MVKFFSRTDIQKVRYKKVTHATSTLRHQGSINIMLTRVVEFFSENFTNSEYLRNEYKVLFIIFTKKSVGVVACVNWKLQYDFLNVGSHICTILMLKENLERENLTHSVCDIN